MNEVIGIFADRPDMATGMAVVCRNLALGLSRYPARIIYFGRFGCEVGFSKQTAVHENILDFDYVPCEGRVWKPKTVIEAVEHYGVDYIFSEDDFFSAKGLLTASLKTRKPLHLLTPIDSLPIHPRAYDIFKFCKKVYVPNRSYKLIKNGVFLPHGCLSPNTQIIMEDNNVERIDDIVEQKINKRILSIGGFTRILNWQKIPLGEPMLRLYLEDGRILEITKDNPIFTQRGWISSGEILLTDSVYAYMDEYNVGISCWNNRRRRFNLFNKLKTNKRKEMLSASQSKNNNNKSKRRLNDIPKKEFPFQRLLYSSFWWIYKFDSIKSRNEWSEKNFDDFKRDITISNSQKTTSNTSNRILREQIETGELCGLYRKRLGNKKNDLSFEWKRIVEIEEIVIPYVYDLKTESSEFLANGILVHNCDTNLFHPENHSHNENHTFTFLWVGRDEPRKAMGRAIMALEKIYKKVDCKMIIHSDWRADMAKRTARFLRYKRDLPVVMTQMEGGEHSKLRQIYNNADAFICTSKAGGFEMGITEAMACGLPAIVTDWTFMQELIDSICPYMYHSCLIKGCANGLLIPVSSICEDWVDLGDGRRWGIPLGRKWGNISINALADAMRFMVNNREVVGWMGQKALEKAKKYNWNDIAGKLYGEIMNE